MPIPHPRRRLGGGGRLDQRGHVRDGAPPGWFWEVLPSGGRRLVRSQPVIDPILVWWRSRGPVTVPRLPVDQTDPLTRSVPNPQLDQTELLPLSVLDPLLKVVPMCETAAIMFGLL